MLTLWFFCMSYPADINRFRSHTGKAHGSSFCMDVPLRGYTSVFNLFIWSGFCADCSNILGHRDTKTREKVTFPPVQFYTFSHHVIFCNKKDWRHILTLIILKNNNAKRKRVNSPIFNYFFLHNWVFSFKIICRLVFSD